MSGRGIDAWFDGEAFKVFPCVCGGSAPCSGWMAPPVVYYLHCPACGHWADAATAARVVARWNLRALVASKVVAGLCGRARAFERAVGV